MGDLPNRVKTLVRSAIRATGTATAPWRGLPDFLVVGVKRGGTTTLFRALQDHPDVEPFFPAGSDLKSPHYFDLNYERGEAWYRSHFASRPLGGTPGLIGESSPYYLFHPTAPARIARLLPESRSIILLRNPVDRAFSHYWDRVKNGVESLSFEDAIDAEGERLAGERERLVRNPRATSDRYEHFSYVARGHYAEQLRAWYTHFDRDQVLVLRSEDLYAEPDKIYDRVLEFLDLAPHVRAGDFGKHHGHADRPTVPPEVRRRLDEHFAPLNSELAELLGTEVWW